MASGLGELFVELGTIGDTAELEKFVAKVREGVVLIEKQLQLQKKTDEGAKKNNTTVKNTTASLGALITTLVGAGIAWQRMTDSLVKSNQALLLVSRQSDIALSTFQKWESIGRMFGINGLAGQIEGLNKRLFELRLTGQGAHGFLLAGINPSGDANQVMEQIRNRIAGMDNTTASYLLQQMGLDPQMITLLKMGREEFEDLWSTVNKYQLTTKQRKEIEKLNVQLQILSIKMQYIKDRIVLALMPAFVKIAESLASIVEMFARFGHALTKNGGTPLRALALGTTLAALRFEKFGKFVKSIGTGLGELITKIPIVGRLFAGLGKVVTKALLPLMALWYLLDDLAVFFEGGDSLIGRVIDWGEEQGTKISDVAKKMFGGDFWGGLGDGFSGAVDILNDILEAVNNILAMIVDFLTLGLSSKIIKTFNDEENHPVLNKIRKTILPTPEEIIDDMTDKSAFVTPDMYQNIDNSNSSQNSDTKIAMTNYIQTNQPVDDISNEIQIMQAQYSTIG